MYLQLTDRLRRIKGRFLLSLADVPEVRCLFRGCRIKPVSGKR